LEDFETVGVGLRRVEPLGECGDVAVAVGLERLPVGRAQIIARELLFLDRREHRAGPRRAAEHHVDGGFAGVGREISPLADDLPRRPVSPAVGERKDELTR
jgi:hypothetical protein